MTASVAVSQLTWRVFGPNPSVVHPVLEWVNAGVPHDPETGEVWTRPRLDYRIRVLRAVGQRTPLHFGVAGGLLHHLATSDRESRMRRVLALPPPGRRMREWLRLNTATSVRVLAAVGPQDPETLQAAVSRTHRMRSDPSPVPSLAAIVEGVLTAGGSYHLDTNTLSAPAGAAVWPRDAALLALAERGAVYSRRELADLLVASGVAASSAFTNTVSRHPLIRPVGRNQFRLIASR